MQSNVLIPKGEEKVTIELTVKEAIALSGVRFKEKDILLEARKKVMKKLEESLY